VTFFGGMFLFVTVTYTDHKVSSALDWLLKASNPCSGHFLAGSGFSWLSPDYGIDEWRNLYTTASDGWTDLYKRAWAEFSDSAELRHWAGMPAQPLILLALQY